MSKLGIDVRMRINTTYSIICNLHAKQIGLNISSNHLLLQQLVNSLFVTEIINVKVDLKYVIQLTSNPKS